MFKKVGLLLATVAGLSPNPSSSAQSETSGASPTVFERILSEVRAGRRDMNEVWPVFLNTTFFVPVHKLDQTPGKTSDFAFVLFPTKTPGQQAVFVSEYLERLENKASENTIKVKGGKLVQLVNPELEIVIVLSDGAFGIPVNLTKWLRESIQTEKR